MTSAPPRSVQVAPDSLYARAPAPPKVPAPVQIDEEDDAIDSGWDV